MFFTSPSDTIFAGRKNIMVSRKTIFAYAAFYGILVLLLGGFLFLKFGFFLGNMSPGESKVFQASVFVNKLSPENKVFFAVPGTNPIQWRAAGAGDKLEIEIENIQNFGFFIEYARQPRCTFDYRITAEPGAEAGRYFFKISFDSGFEYQDSIIIRRAFPLFS